MRRWVLLPMLLPIDPCARLVASIGREVMEEREEKDRGRERERGKGE